MFLLLEENDVVINMNNIKDFYIYNNDSQIRFNLINSYGYACDFGTYEKAKAAFNSVLLKIKSGNPVIVLRDYKKV